MARLREGRALDVRFSVTIRQQPNVRALIEAIPEEDWTPIPYWIEGGAAVAETTYTPFRHKEDAAPVRLIVRRVKPTPGSQLALFTSYSYHAFISDRAGELLELDADHRRHAEVKNAIRDLKYGVRLNHLPSGRFAANAAWLAVQVIAHNLARWTARLGLGEGIMTTRTLRQRYFSLAGRLTRSARRWTPHLPQRWPSAGQWAAALARLRARPLLAPAHPRRRPANAGIPAELSASPASRPVQLRSGGFGVRGVRQHAATAAEALLGYHAPCRVPLAEARMITSGGRRARTTNARRRTARGLCSRSVRRGATRLELRWQRGDAVPIVLSHSRSRESGRPSGWAGGANQPRTAGKERNRKNSGTL